MEWRTKLGALLGAGGLLLLAASTVFAVPPGGPPGGGPPSSPPGGGPPASHPGGGPPTAAPTVQPTVAPTVNPGVPTVAPTSAPTAQPPGQSYSIDIEKSAEPALVPPSGGDVTYTITVVATGSGFFNTVVVDDGMVGCTLSGPTGDDGDDKLKPGETWTYTCTVTGVTPGTENTATANGCHDKSACVDSHDATDTDAVTVGEGDEPPATEAPPTDAPATNAPSTPNPTDAVLGATQPTTDAEFGGSDGAVGSNSLLLILSLAMLLASLVLVTPSKPVRQR